MRAMVCFLAALAAAALTAAPATAPAFASSFTKPPAAALKALKATVGKPFKTGIVFIDGRYVPPPYTVARYGTTLRINGIQVTNEIVPWEEFVKTQEGVTVSKEVAEPAAEEPPEPEPEPEDDFEEEDDSDSSLDDLFDDDPAPKKAKKPAPKRRPARAKPRKPAVTVSYTFDGAFVPNDRTKAYVEKINQARTRLDKHLRAGGLSCFGARYSAITGDAGAARHLLEKLPEIMRDTPTSDAFSSALHTAGFAYFPPALVADIHRHRYEYPRLLERRRAMAEEKKWSAILGGDL